MSEGDGVERKLKPGAILRRGETLYIVERGPSDAGDIVVGELGDRRVKPEYMFDLGDDCPIPTCDGEVVESTVDEGRRRCSEGCLEWLPGRPIEGEECPSCGEGEVEDNDIVGERYSLSCTDDCGWFRGGVQRWREAWLPYKKDSIVEELKERGCSA